MRMRLRNGVTHFFTNRLRLNDIRLRNKFLVMYVLCTLTPIMFTNILFFNWVIHSVEQQRIANINVSIKQVHLELGRLIEAAVGISSVLYNDYNLYVLLEEEYENSSDFVFVYNNYMRRIFNSYTPVNSAVHGIKIYTDNATLLHSGGVAFISDDIRRTYWYKTIQSSNNAPMIIKSYKEDMLSSEALPTEQIHSDALDTFNIIRKMNVFESFHRYEKIMKIELKTQSIELILTNLNIPGHVYVVDEHNLVQYTTNPEVNWKSEYTYINEIKVDDSIIVFQSESYDVQPLQGWKLIAYVPESEIVNKVPEMGQFVVIISIINLVAATMIILIITRSITKRLAALITHIKKVKHGNFNMTPMEESNDEIGQVTSEFNRMRLQIKTLINEVYVADLKEKDMELEHRYAQLNALQSQINPHFLFNALETIRMRSVMKNEAETAKIIHNMAKLFRSSLTWKRDKVKLKEEIEFVICFLEIQKYRFGDRLNYSIEVDEDAYSCLIPKMIFLPFVENACIHGVEKVKQGGHVLISIKLQAQRLLFKIQDNGVGMGEDKIQRIYSYLNSHKDLGDRIGMQNVLYRLKLFYGSNFEFQIKSEIGAGTTFYLEIPIHE